MSTKAGALQILLFDELVDRYSRIEELAVRDAVAAALIKKAELLGGRDKHEKAVEILDELAARLGEASEPELRATLAVALLRKSHVLQVTGRYEQSIVVDDEVVERFSEDPPPGCPYAPLDALAAKAWALSKLGRRRVRSRFVMSLCGATATGRSFICARRSLTL